MAADERSHARLFQAIGEQTAGLSGGAVARLEGRIALGDLLDRLPNLRRASAEPWEPRAALHVHGPNRLPVRFEK